MSPGSEVLQTAVRQSAADLSAEPADFFSGTNLCTAASASAGRRRSLPEPLICQFVSYGSNVVASAAPSLVDKIRKMLSPDWPAWMFFQPAFTASLARLLQDRGIQADLYLDTCFLPRPANCPEIARTYSLEILEGEKLASLDAAAWPNALSQKHREHDVLAAGAFEGSKLAALAGCSEESATMWQIGVDVLPEYRRHSLGSFLVFVLAAQTFGRHRIPYYTAASANLPSVNTAVAAGFEAAWVQLTAAAKS